MKLKSFTTMGFKSFAEKTELNFDKGITAIVGPNGSGKSNISDAIRWVLGEQSSKNLRGGKMEDVIFNGTSKRRQLGLAEVNLVFDNSDHQLPLDFDEVSLTRRLYRSGDSEYQINKKNVRLKDIIDLMADTGLGKGSMSIIGQNKIDEILNARPEERRTIFEEAAGIAKYRMRKKEAMRKLEETSQNLLRINDIKVEKESQLVPMEAAAAKTMRFNELDEQLKKVRLTEFMRKIDNVDAAKQKLVDKQNAWQLDLSEKQTVLGQREAEAVELQHAVDKINDDFANLQGIISEKETALERLRGEINLLQEKYDSSTRTKIRLEEANKNLENQVTANQEILENLANDFDALERTYNGTNLVIKQKQEERDAAQARLDAATHEQNDAQGSYFQGMQELLAMDTELKALEKEQEDRVKLRDDLKENITILEAQADEVDKKGRSTADELARVEQDLNRFTTESQELGQRYDKENQEAANLQLQKNEVERRFAMAEARLNSLEQMQETYDGFGNGIRAVMKSEAPWRQQIIGVAAELIEVKSELVTAIETALGEGAQNIVTENAQTAKTAIRYLKDTNSGRATFLPLDTISPKPLQEEEKNLANLPGVLGYAFDLIKCDAKAEAALRFLLSRILVAEDLDRAHEAAQKARFRIRVVTLDGDVVNVGGSLTGGARRQREGYLTREKTIAELKETTTKLEDEILTWQEKLEVAQAVAAQTQKDMKALEEQSQKTSLRFKELQLEVANLQREKNDAEQKLTQALGERTDIANAYMAQRERVKELRDQLQQRQNQDQGAKEKLDELNSRITKEQTAITALDNTLNEEKIKLGNTESQMKYMEQRMQDLDQSQGSLQEQIAKNEEELEKNLHLAEDFENQRGIMKEQEEKMMLDLAQSAGGKEQFTQARAEAQAKHEEAEAAAQQQRVVVDQAEGKMHQIEMDLIRVQADYDHAIEQLDLEYHMSVDLARAAGLLNDSSDNELKRMDKQLTSDIIALGPVNPAAVEEYNAAKEQAELYQKQYADLVAAKDNLETVIAEINSGMSSRFQDAFAQINMHFAECYKELFGGGTAILKLAENDDPLECGIEIEAQPPGKKLQGLFLLSGGERALTVIALLFALLSYQPSPFCILDEIDAPLDDANIGRFSNFLHNYAQKTQFIVITHRKGTMESADIMYGVTMQESGVSKMLSVKINDGTKIEGIEA